MSVFIFEVGFLYATQDNFLHVKQNFVKLSQMPDLSLSNEAHFIRHRSYSDTFSIFANSPELLEYFPSSFVYHHPTLNNPSKISHE